jgi:pimeloyl-ACP methyl ester carboxylesterase
MSGGAATAQLAALEHPSRVATLTLACATPGIPGTETGDLPPPTVRFPAASAVDWSDRDAAVAYLVEAERPYAAQFDEVGARALMERVVDRAVDIRASATKPFEVDPGAPWRRRLGDIAVPTLVVHGRQDPMFPPEHGRALAAEIPDAELLILDGMGHEHLPPATWDLVVPAILGHTA